MTDLDDDIRRIAALRGQRAEFYQAAQREAEKPRISWALVDMIATIPEGFDPSRDLEWFDRLPPAIRAAVRELDLQLNSMAIYSVWFEVRDESLVLQTIATAIRRKTRP